MSSLYTQLLQRYFCQYLHPICLISLTEEGIKVNCFVIAEFTFWFSIQAAISFMGETGAIVPLLGGIEPDVRLKGAANLAFFRCKRFLHIDSGDGSGILTVG